MLFAMNKFRTVLVCHLHLLDNEKQQHRNVYSVIVEIFLLSIVIKYDHGWQLTNAVKRTASVEKNEKRAATPPTLFVPPLFLFSDDPLTKLARPKHQASKKFSQKPKLFYETTQYIDQLINYHRPHNYFFIGPQNFLLLHCSFSNANSTKSP